MDMPRIKEVSAAKAPLTLDVVWNDGSASKVDLTGLVYSSEHFRVFIEQPGEFQKVKSVNWGDGIGWENGLDYSANTLKTLADEQRPVSGKHLVKFEKEKALNIHETARLFSVTPRTIKNWRHVRFLPLAVGVTLRQFENDPTLFAAHFRPSRVRPRGRPAANSGAKRSG